MALSSYDESGYGNFLNFYEKGAVIASLLDIRLLELSKGKMGLREIFLELLQNYGKYKPFSENDFFDELVNMTFPEIRDFIDNYITGTEPLPYKEYFNKLGYKYIPERILEGERPSFGTNLSMNENMEIITIGVYDEAYEWGLREGDILLELFGEQVNFESIKVLAQRAFEMEVGNTYEMKIKRGNKVFDLKGRMLQRKQKHVFEEYDLISPEQSALRDAWTKNLEL